MTADPDLHAEISTSEAAALLGRSTTFVRALTRDGYIPQLGRGQYRFADVASGVVRYYDDRLKAATAPGAANNATLARTREIELRTAERARSLIPIEDALTYHGELAQQVRDAFADLPAQVARDDEMRRAMEGTIEDILARLARTARERSADLRAGRLDADAE